MPRRSYRPFIALEAATVISGTGNGVAAIALPWLTLQLTNDPAAAGLVVAAGALPQLVASLASGVIIDRLGRQRTSVGSDIFSAASAALIPIFGLLNILTFPLVMVASVLGAVFDPVGVTAREAMIPDVAKRAQMELERVNGIHEASWGIAWLIGPGVAGILISTVGAEAAFWAMSAGFAVSAVLVGAVCMPTPPVHEANQQWFSDAVDGLRYVISEPAIRSTTVLSTLAFTLAYSSVAVVLPVMYEALDKPVALSTLFIAFSAAGVVGALVYGAVGTRVRRRTAFLGGLVGAVLVGGAFAFEPPYWAQVVAMAVSGFMTGPVSPIANVVLQERTDETMRGRALAMVFALTYALFPVGYVAAGFMVKAYGTTATFAAMAIGTAIVVVWAFFTPALRGIEAPVTEAALPE